MNDKTRHHMQQSLFDLHPGHGLASSRESVSDCLKDEILESLLALASVKGIGFKTLQTMFDSGFLWQVWDWSLSEIRQHWSQILGNYKPELARAIHDDKCRLREIGHEELNALRREDVFFSPLGHDSYPPAFRRLPEPPRWIFGRGQLEVLHSTSVVGMVGTRNPSEQGKNLAYRCATELVRRNIVVLSGLARGIDQQAHLGAVHYYGQSIGILGHGIRSSYTKAQQAILSRLLENEGAVLSEYLPSERPSRGRFLRRNELLAAMSRTLIPVECPSLKSGTGATIRRAMKLNTPVVGILPAGATEQSLIASEANLSSLGHPVFTVMGDKSDRFWDHLRSIVQDHDWEPDPRPRQERLFRNIETQLLAASKRVELDPAAIDRLAERLKCKLARRDGG